METEESTYGCIILMFFRDGVNVPVGFYNHNPKIDVSTKKQKSQNKAKKLAIVKNASSLSFELTQKS